MSSIDISYFKFLNYPMRILYLLKERGPLQFEEMVRFFNPEERLKKIEIQEIYQLFNLTDSKSTQNSLLLEKSTNSNLSSSESTSFQKIM